MGGVKCSLDCGDCKDKSIHRVGKPLHIVIFLLNIFFPGIGTMISACINKANKLYPFTIVIGLLQLLTAWLLIGWIWSIVWGWFIFKKSD